ncbi:MAG: alpha/beta fold hydrolase [Phenylobacterium sp.]|uniref:alpha/beta fold hydrolase n=1 Tax=Phenylobacterium sp. TaxID=1871053 RepID=UPI0025F24C54|nr:alpha/beta hydrolase [Phenylobacterium sp.]MBI1198222.1 alpha/beta fold hydrolase [Phenylobacterium sp.]
MRTLARIGLVLLVVALAATAAAAAGFLAWRGKLERNLARNSRIVATARGPIEMAEHGEGRPILVSHGTPGGYDATLNYLEATGGGAGLRYILPSRPGYLKTPLSVGRTPAEQAEAFAALLDRLGVERVAILAVSGGGPAALEFALAHPDRCSALILEEAVTVGQPATSSLPGDLIVWLERPLAAAGWRQQSPDDPAVPALSGAVMDALAPQALRAAGTANDLDQLSRLRALPLDRVSCPTLIIHGTADQAVPLASARQAHAMIAGSRLVELQGADHMMVVTRRREIDAAINEFLSQHPG